MQSLSRYRHIATWQIPKQSRVGRGVKTYILLSVLTCALTTTSGCRIFQTPKLDLRTSTLKPLTEDTSASDDNKNTSASGQTEESNTADVQAKIRGQSPDSSTPNRYRSSTSTATELPGLPKQTQVAQEEPVQPLSFQATPSPSINSGSSGSSRGNPHYGYGSPAANGSPSTYQSTIAPGAVGNDAGDSIAPFATSDLNITAPEPAYQPRERVVPIDVFVQEARTGRIMVGGSVNSDLGVAGQLTISEQNFDIRRIPRSWEDLRNGRAFKGGGQNFRLELMPGNRVERYTVSWTERNLFGYLPYSVSVGGYYYTRQFRDWTEQKLGGRFALGYEVTKDLAASAEIRMEDVKLFDPRITGVSELDSALGSNDLYTARFRVARDTRDSPFLSSRGAYFEMVFDQVFGEYDYQRGRVNYSRYFTMRERPDGTGKHILAATWKLGFTGSQTPIFENFFAGGYSTLRGFSFRGAGPVVNDVQVGGEFMALGSLEYVFPLTADEMLRMVAFVDYGTIEENIEVNSENFRVAPGLGLRVTVPALGPAPLAFDFAYPINYADNDDRQIFSFFMGFTRQ
ncbi:MAG: BamA/TamA family outer membrane protein [Planctomycetota bacterium]|nr:BamA/TamA family outer membrane protein [Planctomycetota bacterium]